MANLTPEAQAQLADLTVALANNPKTRKTFANMVKEIDPSKRFPDVETDEIRENMQKEFDKRDRAQEAERVTARLEAQRNNLRDRYDDNAIEEIEKIMQKHGIADYDVGAKVYAADLKPAHPTHEIQSRAWEMPKFEVKDVNNLTQRARTNAYSVIDELHKNRRRA